MRAAPATFAAVLGLSLLAALVVPRSAAQISAEEQRKRDLFLKARESIQPAPAATPSKPPVRPQPRPRPVSDGVEQPLEPAKPITLPPPRATPPATPRPKATPVPRATPRPKATPPPRNVPPVVAGEPEDIVLPPPKDESDDIIKLPPPRTSAQEEKEKPASDVPAAPIVVEKSGAEEDQGMAPVPEREKRGWFGLGGPRYRYLTRSVRNAIDRAPVKRGRWQYIIVHNSATRQGNARIFANYHKNVRKMKNGLAYHFVIGNGTSSGDGEIEIGSRWTRQINGGHVASDYLNNISIGICFVGDFNRDVPTKAQLAALEEIIKYLRKRCGRSKGRVLIVKAHREINPKPTDCPGNRFPYRWLHRTF